MYVKQYRVFKHSELIFEILYSFMEYENENLIQYNIWPLMEL